MLSVPCGFLLFFCSSFELGEVNRNTNLHSIRSVNSGVVIVVVIVVSGPGRAVREYQQATESIEAAGADADALDKAMERFERATAAMDRVGGWDVETFASQVAKLYTCSIDIICFWLMHTKWYLLFFVVFACDAFCCSLLGRVYCVYSGVWFPLVK